jgi:glucose-6-phosphate dehydrogenase assembly protein OpcA
MTDTIQPILFGEPRPANVAALEAELSALWRSAAEDARTQGAVTRACALTLLVYVESEEAAREVNRAVAEVTRQNPCRAIVMQVDATDSTSLPSTFAHGSTSLTVPERSRREDGERQSNRAAPSPAERDRGAGAGSPPGLTASVSAHCHLPAAGEKQVCSEQITLRARGAVGQELTSVVLPLTVSGLPIHLWWRAAHFSPPSYLEQVLRVTEHVMVDSARFLPGGSALREVAGWMEKFSGRMRVTDLNWARITPWRELIAQCFDAPERRAYLERLTEVRIEYEQESARLLTQRAQGLLLAAWLATRLGWEFVKSEEQGEGKARRFFFQAGSRPIRVERILQRVQGGGAGVCFSIELKADGSSPARFSFSRGLDGKVVRTSAEVPGMLPLGRSVRVEVLGEAEILNEELKLAGRDHVYEEALRMVARMTSH